jgi:hypothetical protein
MFFISYKGNNTYVKENEGWAGLKRKCFFNFHENFRFLKSFRKNPACGVIDTAWTVHAVSMTRYASCIRCHWHGMHMIFTFWSCSEIVLACGVNYTTYTMHAVLMTPNAQCMRYQWYRMHMCMQSQWYRMHHACGINDTACTKQIFAQLRKVKIICKTKAMTPHAFYKNLNMFANSNLYSKRL